MTADIIVALDLASAQAALDLVERLGDEVDFYKVGSPLYTRTGPAIVHALRERGKRVFLDLKFHDIPNTVAGAVASAADLGVDLLTLHAGGGVAMMEAARAAVPDSGPRLLGVTVLTSFSAQALGQAWGRTLEDVAAEVDRLAGLALGAGLDGLVSSPLEAAALRARFGSGFVLVTPGIRPSGHGAGDQVRIATPTAAARAGATYLVIGRPVIEAADPAGVIRVVRAELALEVA